MACIIFIPDSLGLGVKHYPFSYLLPPPSFFLSSFPFFPLPPFLIEHLLCSCCVLGSSYRGCSL